MADITKVQIETYVGSTIQVQSGPYNNFDFFKPSAAVKIEFDGIPSEEEIRKAWDWMWEEQVVRQAEEMLDFMISAAAKRGLVRDPGAARSVTPLSSEVIETPEPAVGEAYT